MPDKEPLIRIAAYPANINLNGHIFGGWILSQMDVAGGIASARRARGPVATVAIEAMKFIKPVMPGDLISCYAEVVEVGTTSMTVDIKVIAERRNGEEICVTTGHFIYVAIGEDGRPRPVDQP